MSPEIVIDLFRQAHTLVVIMVSVIIGPGLLLGLVVALFQATTQINEQTLGFLPKLIVTLITLSLTGHWLLGQLLGMFEQLFLEIPGMIG